MAKNKINGRQKMLKKNEQLTCTHEENGGVIVLFLYFIFFIKIFARFSRLFVVFFRFLTLLSGLFYIFAFFFLLRVRVGFRLIGDWGYTLFGKLVGGFMCRFAGCWVSFFFLFLLNLFVYVFSGGVQFGEMNLILI